MSGKQTTMILAMATVIQLPLLFIGFDLADTGFYMTFYDRIFSAPESVEYNFMYYLTGIIGGSWHLIWPGVFSLRVLAILMNLWTIWVLTEIVPDGRAILLTAALILFGLYVAPLTFNYDTLTATLTVTGLWLMLRNDKYWLWPFLGGMLLGVNVFSRISNLAGIGYGLFYIIAAIWHGRRILRNVIWYLTGWISGIITVLLLMAALGHTDIFLSNVAELFSIAGAEGDEASHGMGNLIAAQLAAWYLISKFTVVACVLLAGFLWIRKTVRAGILRIILMSLIGISGAYIMYRSAPVTVVAGIGLTGCIATFFNSRDHRKSDIALAGLLMMFIMPLGSDGGIYNNGTLAEWLAVACAMNGFISTRNVRNRNLVPGFRASAILTCVFSLLMVVHLIRSGVYFDESHIGDKFVKVSGQTAYTSQRRAKLVEELVSELNRFVKPGDILMVYGSGPTLNYLTDTRPWLGCSWPEQFMVESLKRRMESSEEHPVIAILRFNTLGPRFGNPSDDYAMGGDENIYHNRRKSAVVYDYLRRHGYRPVDSTPYITIYAKP